MLENTRVVAPAGAAVDRFGYLKNGTSDVTENVQLQKEIPAPIGGEADGILWRYDPGTKTFTASGAGVFRRSEDYDEYLAQMRCFRTEYGITALDDSVIRDSENLQSVFLVRSIERIGRNNFVNCPRLAEINLPNGLKYVMEGCFCGSGLKTVNFPRTLLRIDDGCFSNMPELEIISFDFSEELSRLAVGDDCFAHLPAAKELRFGDGPWIIGDRSFCDMPQLRIMTLANFDKRYDPGSDEKRYFRIFFGADTCYIGDGSFADLPNANYQKGLRLYTNDVPQMYHYVINNDSRLRSIGKGSLGFIGGAPDGSYYIGGSDQHDEIFAARYAEANGLGHYSILEWNYLSPHPAPGAVGDANLDSVVDENDAAAMLAYLNQPLKAEGCGDPRTSDVDLSAKLDNRDLILLRRYLAGWPDLDSIFRPRYGDVRQARSNYSAATGLKLTTDSVSVDYEEGLILRVPVRSVYNAGYISGSATVKWNAELMDLWDIEYNDALAPENGTAAIDNNLHYLLTDPSGITPAVDLDYAGEQVIRFGDDFRTENHTGTGELFTLVFRLRAEGKPDPYLLQRDCEIVLKNVDVYDAALNAVRAEQTEVGTVTVTLSDPVIRSVSIAGILNPHPGQHPVDSAVLPEGASYRLRYNDDLSGSVVWLTMENYRMKESETFEAGKQYQALILLEPVSNAYRFSSSEVFTGTVNGMSATPWASNDGTEATLLYTFTCANGVPVSGVSLNKTELKLEPGGSDTLAATVAPTNASNQRFSWSSSDSAVASVDQNGKVTAHKGGDAIITVTTEDQGKTAFCAVRVDIGVSGVTLNTNKLNLYVDGSETLRAMVAPYNVINKNVVWSSSDDSIASVDQNGRVRAIRGGTAVVTVVTADSGKTASCTVTVTGGIVNPFVDIKEGEFYYDAVLWAVNHEPQITTGTSATKFSPGKTCTRGQIVTFLYRAMK